MAPSRFRTVHAKLLDVAREQCSHHCPYRRGCAVRRTPPAPRIPNLSVTQVSAPRRRKESCARWLLRYDVEGTHRERAGDRDRHTPHSSDVNKTIRGVLIVLSAIRCGASLRRLRRNHHSWGNPPQSIAQSSRSLSFAHWRGAAHHKPPPFRSSPCTRCASVNLYVLRGFEPHVSQAPITIAPFTYDMYSGTARCSPEARGRRAEAG